MTVIGLVRHHTQKNSGVTVNKTVLYSSTTPLPPFLNEAPPPELCPPVSEFPPQPAPQPAIGDHKQSQYTDCLNVWHNNKQNTIQTCRPLASTLRIVTLRELYGTIRIFTDLFDRSTNVFTILSLNSRSSCTHRRFALPKGHRSSGCHGKWII